MFELAPGDVFRMNGQPHEMRAVTAPVKNAGGVWGLQAEDLPAGG